MSTLAAEIVTSGTEILLGDIVDTNAVWIAQQLREVGVNLYYKTTVGDNELRLRGIIELGMTRSQVIIITGGLGPTVDDVTRQAIANATGCPLQLHEGALATLKERFVRFGATMTDNNRQQALIPAGAILIENPVGTAPGFIVEGEQATVIALPGVPREMKQLMADTVLPYLRQRMGKEMIIRRRILRTFGIGESTIDDLLGDLMHAANPTVGLAAKTGQVDIRIAARADDAAAAEIMLDGLETKVRALVGPYIYSTTPDETYETVLARQLVELNATVAVLETNTRGAIAARLTAALPAYTLVAASVLAATAVLPMALAELTAPDGLAPADRQRLAGEAAEWVRSQQPATLGIAVVGTTGADEGVFGKKNGESWLGMSDGRQTKTLLIPFGGQDEYTHVRISNQVLATLRRWADERAG